MQLRDRSGICCDSCGIEYRTDFTYYSFDFHNAAVYNNQRQSIDMILRSKVVFSVDICTNCFEAIKKMIVANYATAMSPKRSFQSAVTCDITGQKLTGSYEYYYCEVIKIDVTISGQPNVCVKCKAKTFDDSKVCAKCSNKEFVRLAAVKTDRRYVELNVCDDAYRAFVTKAEAVRKVAGQWSSKS